MGDHLSDVLCCIVIKLRTPSPIHWYHALLTVGQNLLYMYIY